MTKAEVIHHNNLVDELRRCCLLFQKETSFVFTDFNSGYNNLGELKFILQFKEQPPTVPTNEKKGKV